MKTLRKQVALITGVGSETGIGFDSAQALGRDGASLALVSTTERIHERVKDLEREGLHARGYVGDLTKPEVVQFIVEDIHALYGRLDICINNAGMVVLGEEQLESRVEDIPMEEWQRSIERNLTTCFLVTKA